MIFNDFRFRRGGVFARALGISSLVAILFVVGCTTNSAPPQFAVTTTSVQLPVGVVNTAYTPTSLAAANGTAPYSWSVTGGALPAGMSVSSAGVLSGTPTANGSFNFTVQAKDSATTPHTATASLMLKVNQAPAITSGNSTTFTVGTAGTFTATATGFPAPTFSETGALPSGVTLNLTTGVLSGTPGAGTGGTYPITITAQNGVTPNATQSFTLTVNQAPTVTSANSKSFVVGALGSFTVTASGFPAPTLGEAGALPTGVTFNTATGILAGTPGAGTQGSYPITFTAQNGIGTNATQNFTLTVGLAPAITSAGNTTFAAGTSGTFTVVASGFPAPTFSETGALPAGVTLTATGVLSGTPGATTGGTYPITITAQNGIAPNATQNFTLTVNQAPAITSANSKSFAVGTLGSFIVTAGGFPAPTFSETGALPSGVTLNSTTGVLSGTPANGTQGNYPIVITAQNSITPNATQNFTLTVDLAPAITSGNSTTFTAGTAGAFTVTATGFPAPTFSETGALPAGVTLNSTTGALGGIPGANTGGTYPITITAQNGVGSNATQNFTLTVNQAPAITSANNTTFAVASNNIFTVTASGFPIPTLSVSGTLPSGVSFNAATGALSGIPASGTQAGSPYPITFTAQNGIGTNATQNFTLNVSFTAPPSITSANNTTFTAGASGTFTVTATGAPSPTFSETGALPSGVTLNSTTGVLSGTPGANTGGTFPITITAQNGIAPNATQSFTLTVDQAPAITSSNNTAFTVGVNGTFTITATGMPSPTFSETGALPSGVSLNSTTGVLSGTPANGTQGSYPITITAQNTVSPNATQSFTLTVNTAPSFTSLSSTTFTVGTPGTFTVTSAGSPAPTLGVSGSLPNGVTFNSTTGVLSGTPATGSGGIYSITFTANNGVNPNANQNFTLTVNEGPSITSNNSTTFTLGVAGNFTVSATGEPAATLSETGALPSGVTFTPNPSGGTAALSGTPGTGTGGSYPITIAAHNGIGADATQNFTLTVITDPCAGIGTGSESLLNGHYAFTLQGFDNGQGTGETSVEPALVGGVFTANGSGAISAGTLDQNLYSTAGAMSLSMTGSYKIGSDNRACLTFNTSQGAQHYRASLANISGGVASTGHMIGFDAAGPFTAGELRKQDTTAFSTSKVTGNYAFEMATGQENTVSSAGEKSAIAGIIKLSTGSVTGGELDLNDGGHLEGNNTLTSWPNSAGLTINSGTTTYAIDASTGRGTLTVSVPQGSNTATLTDIIYVVSSNDFLILANFDQTQQSGIAAIGEALQQSGSFTSLSGTEVIHISSFDLNGGLGNTTSPPASDILIGTIKITSPGNFSFFAWDNNGGTVSQQGPQTGTYSIDSTGRMLLTGASGGGHQPLFYVVGGNKAFILGSSSGVETGMFEPQTATSITGKFAGGVLDPQDSNSGDGEFVVTFGSGTVSGTSDDNSNGSQNPNQNIPALVYSIDGTGLGSIASSACGIGAPGPTPPPCQLIFYVISPTRAAVLELTNGGGGAQTNPKLQIADQ